MECSKGGRWIIPFKKFSRIRVKHYIYFTFIITGLSESKGEYFSEQWKANVVGLSRSALGQTLMVNQLVDMEWKFGGKCKYKSVFFALQFEFDCLKNSGIISLSGKQILICCKKFTYA